MRMHKPSDNSHEHVRRLWNELSQYHTVLNSIYLLRMLESSPKFAPHLFSSVATVMPLAPYYYYYITHTRTVRFKIAAHIQTFQELSMTALGATNLRHVKQLWNDVSILLHSTVALLWLHK